MRGYQVIARRWRPKKFSEVVGQSHVVNTLVSAIKQGKIAHSYLFSGPRGVGKTSMARIFAKALNCVKGPTVEPCCECENCIEIEKGIFVDVIEMDAASNRGIDEIRELRESVKYAPTKGKYKVYIIDEVHMLTEQAFNALLKTLEEPPSHVIFIFATTEYRRIPQTILSRCIRFDFRPLAEDEAVKILANICEREGIKYDEEALRILAKAASGSLRDAEMYLEQAIAFSDGRIEKNLIREILGFVEEEVLSHFVQALSEGSTEKVLSIFKDKVVNAGYDIYGFVSCLLEFISDRLKRAAFTEDKEKAIKLYTFFKVFLDLSERIKRHPFPDMLFEAELIRLTALPPLEDIAYLIKQLDFKVSESLQSPKEDIGLLNTDIKDKFVNRVMERDRIVGSILNEVKIKIEDGKLILYPNGVGGIGWEKLKEKKDLINEVADSLGLTLIFGEETGNKRNSNSIDLREAVRENPVVNRIMSLFDSAVILDARRRREQ